MWALFRKIAFVTSRVNKPMKSNFEGIGKPIRDDQQIDVVRDPGTIGNAFGRIALPQHHLHRRSSDENERLSA